MKIKELRKAAGILNREGMAERALQIAQDMVDDGSYKRAIEGAGQLEVLSKACTFDVYWDGKRHIVLRREVFMMEDIFDKDEKSLAC